MSTTIADAIVKYKNTISDSFSDVSSDIVPENNPNNTYLKIQIASGSKSLELKSYNFKGINQLSFSRSGNIYKYFFENTNSFNQAKKFLDKAKLSGFKDALIVAFNNGQRITMDEFFKLSSN